MMSNVPDDWGMYYSNCSQCGSQYHLSEGGCSCFDDVECDCGKCDWSFDYDNPECRSCGSGPWEETGVKITFHRARKDHANGRVLKGDVYRKTITIGYFPNGGRMTRNFSNRVLNEENLANEISRMNKEWADRVMAKLGRSVPNDINNGEMI